MLQDEPGLDPFINRSCVRHPTFQFTERVGLYTEPKTRGYLPIRV